MLKRKQSYTFIITDDSDNFVDAVQLEGYHDKFLKTFLKSYSPNNHKTLTIKRISDAELLTSFIIRQKRLNRQEEQQHYGKLLLSATSIEAHEKYDATILLDYLDNLKQAELIEVINETILNLLNLTTGMFLDGSNEGVISRTIIGVLSDIGEELQKDVKVLRQDKLSDEVKKAILYDIISYFKIVSGLYDVAKEHTLYNAKFLDFIIDTQPYLEKIITVKTNRA